jgi:hypothetical protein
LTHTQHAARPSTAAQAFAATRHCLTGCAIGEIVATVVSAALSLPTSVSLVLGIVLAFVFGYSLTFFPLVRGGLALGQAAGITLAADTVSIVVMEAVDNVFVLLVPGAMSAGVADVLFWGSLIVGLAIAFGPAYLVNRWLIARGRGHAAMHMAH